MSDGAAIAIPPQLPGILKEFCKAAIRTQPYDLIKWSGSYFRALAEGEEPPVKWRFEYPPPSTSSGLTLGFLKVLLRQFPNYDETLPLETISHRWDCLCLNRKDFHAIVAMGQFRRVCRAKQFFAIAVNLLAADRHSDHLSETMIMICRLFTRQPDGGSAMIPLALFIEMYEYLAALGYDGSGETTTPVVSDYHTIANLSQRATLEGKMEEGNLDVGATEADQPDDAIGHECFPKQLQRGTELDWSERMTDVAAWMSECANLQEGMVGPRNIRHTDCPPLRRARIVGR